MQAVRTLYLRNVPDDVATRLEELAGREGLSLTAFAVRELSVTARRADNAELLADLPNTGLGVAEIVGALDDVRSD